MSNLCRISKQVQYPYRVEMFKMAPVCFEASDVLPHQVRPPSNLTDPWQTDRSMCGQLVTTSRVPVDVCQWWVLSVTHHVYFAHTLYIAHFVQPLPLEMFNAFLYMCCLCPRRCICWRSHTADCGCQLSYIYRWISNLTIPDLVMPYSPLRNKLWSSYCCMLMEHDC